MNKENAISEILDIFIDILDIDDLQISEKTTSDDIDEWDSLTHIQLIVAIEKHFAVKFLSTEIHEWKDVGEMIKCINGKLGSSGEKESVAEDSFQVISREEEKNETGEFPSYRKNHIANFSHLAHGENCFVGEGVTLTNVKLGDRVWINKFATIYSSHDSVKIGSDCYIGPYVWIEGQAGIEIGNSVHIAGPSTSLYTHSGMNMALRGVVLGNPEFNPPDKLKHYFKVPIRIGNNVWIGPNCSVSPGVIIQDNVVVMPNTAVKSGIIESFSVVQGNGNIEKNADFVRSIIESNE